MALSMCKIGMYMDLHNGKWTFYTMWIDITWASGLSQNGYMKIICTMGMWFRSNDALVHI